MIRAFDGLYSMVSTPLLLQGLFKEVSLSSIRAKKRLANGQKRPPKLKRQETSKIGFEHNQLVRSRCQNKF